MFRNSFSFWRIESCYPHRQTRHSSRLGVPIDVHPIGTRTRVFRLKKKALILFELLIALSLVGVLITMLFSFFVESARIEKKLDIARVEISRRAALQTRLDTLLTALDLQSKRPCFLTKKEEKSCFNTLNLIFDNGIDPDPQYSGSVMGCIFLDSENNLSFLTKPLDEEKGHFRKEVLLPNIVDFEFEFLGPKASKKTKEKPVTSKLAWKKEWVEMQGRVPSMIRLSVKEKNEKEPLQFAVFMPSSDALIEYGEKTAL